MKTAEFKNYIPSHQCRILMNTFNFNRILQNKLNENETSNGKTLRYELR